MQVLKALWEKTQLKGTHSFETAMIQSTFPHQKVSWFFSGKKKREKTFALTLSTKTFTIATTSLLCSPREKQTPFPCPFAFFALAPEPSEHRRFLPCQGGSSWSAAGARGACLPPAFCRKRSAWGGSEAFSSRRRPPLCRASAARFCAVLRKVCRRVLRPFLQPPCGLFLT